MNTKPQVLTKENTKMIAVEAATHRQAKALAAALGVPLYEAVRIAVVAASAMQQAQEKRQP